jgi:VCBS repeat-containing protein
MTYTVTGAPANGIATIVNGDELQFETNGEFEALNDGGSTTVTVEVTADDGNGGTDTSDITVTINGVNDDPTLGAGADAITESATSTIDLTALGADADAEDDGTSLTYSVVSVVEKSVGVTAKGTAFITGGDDLEFSTDGDFEVLDDGDTATIEVTIEAEDAQGATTSNVMTVTINGANDAPEEIAVGNLDLGTINEGSSFSFINAVMTDGSTDVDGDALTITATGGLSSHGATISVDGLGNVTYNASAVVVAADETDTFTFTVSDGTASYVATAEIDIINI